MSNSPVSTSEAIRGATVNALGENSGNGNFTLNDTVGAILLALVAILSLITSLVLFIVLQRAQARNRALMMRGEQPGKE